MPGPGARDRERRRAPISRRLFTTATLATLAGCAQPERRGARAPARAAPRLEPPPVEPEARPLSAATPPRNNEIDLPLLRAHPGLRGQIAHEPLGLFPTPVVRAVSLGDHLGVASLWVKRDDLAGEVYGGGKVRKLEFLLGEAVRVGAGEVITSGGVGSNHAVATAIYAAQLGMRAVLVLLPEPADDRVREHLLADLRFGAEVRLAPEAGRSAAIARRLTGGREPYVIAAGGSSSLGNLGFVNAAFELKDQIDRGEMPEPSVVYVAMGTMGTAVGLALGLRAAGLGTRVVAVRASSPGTSSEARMLAMAAETEAHLRGLTPSFPPIGLRSGDVTIVARQLGAGYGRATRKGLRAIEIAREHAGLELEHVYTGKALAALAEDAPGLSREVVLFWNTHNSRRLDVRGLDPREVPAALRGYFAGQ